MSTAFSALHKSLWNKGVCSTWPLRYPMHLQVGSTPEGVELPRCVLDKDCQAAMHAQVCPLTGAGLGVPLPGHQAELHVLHTACWHAATGFGTVTCSYCGVALAQVKQAYATYLLESRQGAQPGNRKADLYVQSVACPRPSRPKITKALLSSKSDR